MLINKWKKEEEEEQEGESNQSVRISSDAG